MFPFTWDGHWYRDARGRFVSRASVEAAQRRMARALEERMVALSLALQDGTLSLGGWQTGMLRLIKEGHVATYAAARGGWGNLSQADFGRMGPHVRAQYEYLRRFAEQIASGQQPLNGRLIARTRLYARSTWTTFEIERLRVNLVNDFSEVRNILGIAEHCPGCVEATSLGWVKVEDMPPIGTRDCLANCHCHYEYRNAETGAKTRF